MYSPKIKEELVTKLYTLARRRNIPMTQLVNTMLGEALQASEVSEKEISTDTDNPLTNREVSSH